MHLSGGKDRPCVLSINKRNDLSRLISTLPQAVFSFTSKEILVIAFEFAKKLHIWFHSNVYRSRENMASQFHEASSCT